MIFVQESLKKRMQCRHYDKHIIMHLNEIYNMFNNLSISSFFLSIMRFIQCAFANVLMTERGEISAL